MSNIYTKSFKIEAVKKVLSKEPHVSMREISDRLGVKNSTLHGWVKALKNNQLRGDENHLNEQKRPNDWTLSERLDAIITSKGLEGESLNAFCRNKGIFPHHLLKWRSDFTQTGLNSSTDKEVIKQLTQENKSLKKELLRKDKALAEAAALLVLKKKPKRFGERTRFFNFS